MKILETSDFWKETCLSRIKYVSIFEGISLRSRLLASGIITVFIEPRSFFAPNFVDTAIAYKLEERQLACFGRQPRSGDGLRELERQKQFSSDTMITMK